MVGGRDKKREEGREVDGERLTDRETERQKDRTPMPRGI